LRQLRRKSDLRPKRRGKVFGDIEQLTDSLKHYSWTALAELKGDPHVLHKLEEAEKLLKDLRKALGK
jgi:ParB family chromosome partitioning protein